MDIQVQPQGRNTSINPLNSGLVGGGQHQSNVSIQHSRGAITKLPEVNDSGRVVIELEKRVKEIKQENEHLRSKIHNYNDLGDNQNPDDKLRFLMNDNLGLKEK